MLATDPDARDPVDGREACGRPCVAESNRCPDCEDRPAVAPPLGRVRDAARA